MIFTAVRTDLYNTRMEKVEKSEYIFYGALYVVMRELLVWVIYSFILGIWMII